MDGIENTSTEVTPSSPSEVTPQSEPQAQGETITETKETNVEAETPQEQPKEKAEANSQDEETFLGTYKTKEDALKGLKEKDDFIAQTRDKVKKLEEQLESKKETVVTQTGEIDPQVVRMHAVNLTRWEIGQYRESMYGLDSESQAEVNKLLNDFQATGNIKAFEDAKAYFSPKFVEEVSSQKTQNAMKIEQDLIKEQDKFTTERKGKFFDGLPDSVSKFANKDSALYSPLVERYLNENYNRVSAEELAPQFAELEQKIIENYLKTKTAEAQIQKDTTKLQTTPPVGTPPAESKVFTDEEIKKMSPEEYEKNRPLILKQLAQK